jgi:hypothetical protein
MKSFTRARWIAAGLVLGAAVALFAQEPAIFQRGLTIIRGELTMSGIAGNTVAFEGATGNDFETRFIVTDPTADRTITLQDASGIILTNLEVSEIVTAANVIAATECGSTFYLNAAAGFLSTLPTPTSGCVLRFVVHTATSSNGYTIGTPTADIIDGMVVERAGGAGVACQNEDLLTIVTAQMVTGDWLELRSDGTNWYVHGMTDVAAGFTCTVT